MELIKFRIYDPTEKRMVESGATPTMLASFFRATAVLNVRDGMEYQQFTGLLDKTGKEIWGGDIFEGRDGLERPIKGKIGYKVTWGRMVIDEDLTLTFGIARKGTIIGNITENPELLEVLDE